MRVLLVNQYFHPEVAAVAQLMGDLAEDLSAAGFDVGVLCGRASYSPVTNENVRPKQLGSERIRVWRVPYLQTRSSMSLLRLISYGTFLVSAAIRALTLPRYDAVLAFTSPPLVGVIAWIYGAIRRARIVAVVQDLYPDIAIALGFLPPQAWATRAVTRAARFLLRRADRVVALSAGMKVKLVAVGIGEANVEVIHNWADGEEIYPIARHENRFLASHNLEDRFVVQYSGHMGEAHALEAILEAASRLSTEPDILFQFIGDGPRRGEIEQSARRNGLTNVSLLPYQPRHELRESLGAASVALISLRPEATALVVPSKLYGILAAGKPVIFMGSVESEIARVITVAECGFVVGINDGEALTAAILKLRSSPALLRRMGENARNALIEHFERKMQTRKYADLLKVMGCL